MENMYFTYYKPIVKSEHYLLANEIATICNVRTKNDNLATNFVSAFLQSEAKKINNYEQLFYSSSKGMLKVYPKKIYMPIMYALVNNIGFNNLVTIQIENKKYTIKVVK